MGIGWINILLIGTAGLLSITRWRRYRLFPTYALLVAAMGVVGLLPALYVPSVSMLRFALGGGLCLLAAGEAYRNATGKTPWIAGLALITMVAAPLFAGLPDSYWLQREGLVIALLLMFRGEDPVLSGFGLYGGLIIASDIVKAACPGLTWTLLQSVDPLAFTAMSITWLWFLWEPERVLWVEPMFRVTRRDAGMVREKVKDTDNLQ